MSAIRVVGGVVVVVRVVGGVVTVAGVVMGVVVAVGTIDCAGFVKIFFRCEPKMTS